MGQRINPIVAVLDDFAEKFLKRATHTPSKPEELVAELREELLKNLVESYCLNDQGIRELLGLAEAHLYTEVIEGLRSTGTCYVAMKMKSISPLLIGQSEGPLASIFGVGMTFDLVLGLPIIPASSIKGAVKSFLSNLCTEASDEEGERCKALVNHLFGSPETGIGEVVFFDAYPVGASGDSGTKSILKADILTPHYYVGGRPVESELDAQPTPIKHASVSENIVFGVIAAIRASGARADEAKKKIAELGQLLGLGNDWVTALAAFIAGALSIEGAGSRTTKGYGLMSLVGLEAGCGV